MPTTNVYFDLTEELNGDGRIAVLGSGQAVVWHRLAIMSKDGDWILRESPEACARALRVLEQHGARYRLGAPLDVRWLEGGWSSHLELTDERGRRVRCDFFTRPPRLSRAELASLFEDRDSPPVVSIEMLVRMKQTQRAKDYAVIGELARRLEPELELRWTTDPDRVLELAPELGAGSSRPAVAAARTGDRRAVVRALAEEIDEMQVRDRDRLRVYEEASRPFLATLAALPREELRLPEGHRRVLDIAERLLPKVPRGAEP
ncbi:MAG TPA: hypothetical protein VNB06_03045 [Thermoanaerobaculia bacterium]|nr:hypothetical protein [Thermoanaerobaculia bacterium]